MFANDASKPAGSFSVSLVDPTQPAMPVTHAHVGACVCACVLFPMSYGCQQPRGGRMDDIIYSTSTD